MKTLRDYVTETEAWIDSPAAGDEIDFELTPDSLLETYVIEAVEDGVVIEADDQALALLEQHGVLFETIRTYGAVGRAGMGQTYAEDQVAEHGGGIGPRQHWQDLMQEEPVAEGRMKDLAIELEDYKSMTPQEFEQAHGMKKADWAMKHRDIMDKHNLQTDWTGTTGWDYVRETSAYMSRMLELAGVLRPVEEDQPASVVAAKEIETDITNPMPGVHEAEDEDMEEAKYQGREVALGKPMQGDVKKFKVYVRDPKTGNVKKVNFGDKTMRIKKSNPARRRSFRARHRCSNPGPRTKARYWSCRKW